MPINEVELDELITNIEDKLYDERTKRKDAEIALKGLKSIQRKIQEKGFDTADIRDDPIDPLIGDKFTMSRREEIFNKCKAKVSGWLAT